jgi:hypothetical protein
MRIPLILHATSQTSRRLCTPAIRAFLRGQPWNDAISTSSMVEADSVEGLLVLNGPAPLLAGESHFQVFLPLSILLDEVRKGRADSSKLDEAVLASLSTPWGTLGVLAPRNQIVVYPPKLHGPILNAAVAWWDAFDALGPRFTVGLREGQRLWDTTTNLQYVLGQVGVDIARIRAPLPEQGLRAILPGGLLRD